uniref:Uncharacterized protein n=1 Tax=Stegastes partitus TaxID=144197 RepID=A0A3B4YYX5_9TELE
LLCLSPPADSGPFPPHWTHLCLSMAMFPVNPSKLISQYLLTAVLLRKQMRLAKRGKEVELVR